MARNHLTRRGLLYAAAPLAATPVLASIARGANTEDSGDHHTGHVVAAGAAPGGASGHAAMIGERRSRRRAGRTTSTRCSCPPPALPYEPGRVREYTLTAVDREIEVAPGVFFEAWTYNGTVPGRSSAPPRATSCASTSQRRGRTRTRSTSTGSTRRTWTASSRSSSPGGSFTYEFEARPAGMQLYHCHATPLKKHIHKGLYGAFIIDPKEPRPPAQELVMVMNGYDTDGDGENNFYTVNGRAFYYAKYPIRVKRRELVRIYLANLTEFDLINSLHLHGDFFRYYPTGTERPLRVHRHGRCSARASAGSSRSSSTTRARSCSTRTSRSSPSSAGWATSRWSTGGGEPSQRRFGGVALAALGARADPRCSSASSALFVSSGALARSTSSGRTRRRRDELDIRRVEFQPGEIRIRGDEPAARRDHDRLVTVDDAIVPFTLDGAAHARAAALERRSSSPTTGSPTSRSRSASRARPESRRRGRSPAAVETPRPSARGFLGYALIGLLVGVVPIALGLLWLPSLRRADARWLAAFMALTAGLLTFLGVEALSEAFELQATLPAALGGPGLVLLGVAVERTSA